MSTISIIVPIYKVQDYIHKCINSILEQSFSDFDLILVDDGSPDNCGQICDNFAEKDSRIKVIHQKNGGLSVARNTGIEWAISNSDSKWITFIDSDDWIHPEYLELLYKGATESNLNISACGFQKTSSEELSETKSGFSTMTPEDFWCKSRVKATVAWAKLYKKELFNETRYPVGKINEDEYTTYKLLFSQKAVAVLDDVLYAYRINEKGIMKSEWKPQKLDFIEAFENQFTFFNECEYEKAIKKSAIDYITILGYMVYEIKKSGKENNKYYRFAKKKLRTSIKWFNKELKMPISEYIEQYSLAYPYMMQIYKKLKKTELSKKCLMFL